MKNSITKLISFELKRAVKTKNNILFISEPGLGKTYSITKFAKENNYNLVVLIASRYSAEDIGGFLIKSNNLEQDGTPILVKPLPDWAKKIKEIEDIGGKVLLFLDEITTANELVQGALLNIIQDRQIGNYKFKDDLLLVGAGNRLRDLSEEFNLLPPFKSRFSLVHLEACEQTYKSFVLNPTKDNMFIYNNLIAPYIDKKNKESLFKYYNVFSGRGIVNFFKNLESTEYHPQTIKRDLFSILGIEEDIKVIEKVLLTVKLGVERVYLLLEKKRKIDVKYPHTLSIKLNNVDNDVKKSLHDAFSRGIKRLEDIKDYYEVTRFILNDVIIVNTTLYFKPQEAEIVNELFKSILINTASYFTFSEPVYPEKQAYEKEIADLKAKLTEFNIEQLETLKWE